MLQPVVGGIDPTPGKIPLWPMVGGADPTPRSSPMSVDVGGRADQERRIPILRLTGTRPEAAGIQQTGIPMVKQAQQTEEGPVATRTRYPGDYLDIEVIHPSQQKMTKRQHTGDRPMTAGARRADFDPKAETKLYLKRGLQMGKNLITASTQRMDFSLMAVLRWTAMSRAVAKQQINTYPQVISAQ